MDEEKIIQQYTFEIVKTSKKFPFIISQKEGSNNLNLSVLLYKQNTKLKNNIKANAKFSKQVWVVPNERKFIAERIRKYSKELLVQNLEIIMLDDILKVVADADISQNKLRDKPALGERNIELVQQKPNSVVNKYF